MSGADPRDAAPSRRAPLPASHADAKLTDGAAALRVRQPTLHEVVKDLVRKRWVTKLRSVTDTRAVCLSLSRQGQALAQKIE
jgi:DNA-binding MarR family transcriptional regulator